MRPLVISIMILAGCSSGPPAPIPTAISPDEIFKVAGQSCQYVKVHGMWCLFCNEITGVGGVPYSFGGHSCDWAHWEMPASLAPTPDAGNPK